MALASRYGSAFCHSVSFNVPPQVKTGSNNVVVRNNVCYNTYGVCALLYDDYNRGQNVIEGTSGRNAQLPTVCVLVC